MRLTTIPNSWRYASNLLFRSRLEDLATALQRSRRTCADARGHQVQDLLKRMPELMIVYNMQPCGDLNALSLGDRFTCEFQLNNWKHSICGIAPDYNQGAPPQGTQSRHAERARIVHALACWLHDFATVSDQNVF